MNNPEIKLSESDYREVYEGWISKALKTESEVMAEYSNRERELLYKFTEFTYQLLAAIGIFSGFGFTAIDKVKTLWLFISGEGILASAILFGLYWLKKFYESNLSALQNSSRAIFKIYKERDEVFLQIGKDFTERQVLRKSNLLKAQEKDQEVLNWIREHTGEKSEKKETPPHKVIISLSLVGLVIIFLSFLVQICI